MNEISMKDSKYENKERKKTRNHERKWVSNRWKYMSVNSMWGAHTHTWIQWVNKVQYLYKKTMSKQSVLHIIWKE
jgi:hypothetical protein